ncbi:MULTISPECIES: low molecular weight protein arginine phosphatase [Rummeliibacillus]|uniref:low molecular weight protein arginine phosphatase n=1 Tax=Rummeliibacillus TaxID=648802 RepID=UPI0011B74A16|nr:MULTISPECIES: low molecular weight protein arginine phosphatase [Rummeliibacillus]MBO2535506.1 low molecular weight protein arginine phosphatase [Rummeliibacillus suwonensis]
MNIYFICTGNTCRSPMAAAILKSRNLPKTEVKSAGIYAMAGSPMSPNAKNVLEEQHIDYEHISQPVSLEDLRWAHLILTMTTGHKESLLQLFPQVADKTFTLKEYAIESSDLDVLDPFGRDISAYRQTFQELSILMDELEKKLLEE